MIPASTKLIIVSCISVIILASGFLLFKKLLPNKKIHPLVYVIVISLLPLTSLFRSGTYESGDLSLHVYEAMSFYSSLLEGHIFPLWGGLLNATYGYPVFNFSYPLPFYLISFFHLIGFSFITSIKLLLAMTFIFSGIGMYLWIKEELGEMSGIASSLFYMYAPYHLVDMHFRVDIGEVTALSISPFVFYFLKKLSIKTSIIHLLFLSCSVAALILSHQAVSIIVFPILILYELFIYSKKRDGKYLTYAFFSLTIGLLLSLFYWLPLLYELQFTLKSNVVSVSYQNFWEFIYSNWKYGLLFQGPKGQLSYIIGYTQLFIVLYSLYLLVKGKIKKTNLLYLFAILSFFVLFVMMLPISQPIYSILPLFKHIQFSYRFLAGITLCTSLIAGIVVKVNKNKSFIVILCVITILITIFNWGNRRTIGAITDTTLRANIPLSTIQGEGNIQSAPKWVDQKNVWKKNIPKMPLYILKGIATIKQINRTSTIHEYIVNAATPLYIEENTLYFPNWEVLINSKPIPISYQNNRNPGIIFFNAPAGLYLVSIEYNQTFIRTDSQIISITCMIAVLLFFVFYTYLFLSPKFYIKKR